MAIHWFPGHMNKALKAIQERLKSVDVVIEILDARAPMSSSGPLIEKLAQGKKTLKLLNKKDLADDARTRVWIAELEKDGDVRAFALNAHEEKARKIVEAECMRLCPSRGTIDKPVRALVCGIPNVGKSSLINTLVSKKSAKVGDEPGITKSEQRLIVSDGFWLYDTPGMLWQKIIIEESGYRLAQIGSVGYKAYHSLEVALELVDYLVANYPGVMEKRYGLDYTGDGKGADGAGGAEGAGGAGEDGAKAAANKQAAASADSKAESNSDNNANLDANADAAPNGEADVAQACMADGVDETRILDGEEIFGCSNPFNDASVRMLEKIAVKRGAVRKGGLPDLDLMADLVLKDFRSGLLGGVTLETPEEHARWRAKWARLKKEGKLDEFEGARLSVEGEELDLDEKIKDESLGNRHMRNKSRAAARSSKKSPSCGLNSGPSCCQAKRPKGGSNRARGNNSKGQARGKRKK